MKKRMQTNYFLGLILISLFVLGLLFGGNEGFASSKNAYEVIAKKADGAMTTTFHVYALSEYEAKEEVALNGWKIISVKLMNRQGSNERNASKAAVDTSPNVNASDNSMKDNIPSKEVSFKENKYLLVAYFDFAQETALLNENTLSFIKNLNKTSKYVIYGHTDSVPVKKDNIRYRNNHDLSIKRARFIKNEMMRLSAIPKENISIVGLGERFPATSDTEEGQPKNRRVEVYESLR